MNLCDHLQALARGVDAAKTIVDWNKLVGDIEDIARQDEVDVVYSKATTVALLKQCKPASVTYDAETGKTSLTGTLTVA
jgi:hypothetical protein